MTSTGMKINMFYRNLVNFICDTGTQYLSRIQKHCQLIELKRNLYTVSWNGKVTSSESYRKGVITCRDINAEVPTSGRKAILSELE